MRLSTACMLMVGAVSLVLMTGCGPHMNIQQSVKPYEQRMRPVPAGAVPTSGSLKTLTAQQSQKTSPIRPTPDVLKNGRIYYRYYCVQCHGTSGDGNGPVGQSYVPKPTDISSPAISGLTDGELYSRMLKGVGHDPVLEETVIPEHRWPLVLYLRTLSRTAPTAGTTANM